jgi:hypothetical protein
MGFAAFRPLILKISCLTFRKKDVYTSIAIADLGSDWDFGMPASWQGSVCHGEEGTCPHE